MSSHQNLSKFSRFGRNSKTPVKIISTRNVIVYTRVSSKEQADKNLSLETQKRAIEEFAKKNGFSILGYFGGTHESAKTDGRKEFQKMLEFIKKNQGKISKLLVYTLDRFSRTGGAAIKLAADLREIYGVSVFAVTQPTDTSNPSGVLHLNIQLLFSEYDNELRRQKSVAGMREKLEKGIWITKPPQGYDIININGNRKILINEEGKKIGKAFQWKAIGMKNQEIAERLQGIGLEIPAKKLSSIFPNPFYCGLISNRLLDGRIVEGIHEPVVSKELFLRINNPKIEKRSSFETKTFHHDLPLKVFVKCSKCKKSLTGYLVRKKKLYYYKCRTSDCKFNRSAIQMNNLFEQKISNYFLKPEFSSILKEELKNVFFELNEENKGIRKELKIKIGLLKRDLNILEEKYYVKEEMEKDSFLRLNKKYQDELRKAEDLFSECINHSDIENFLKISLELCGDLQKVWTSTDIKNKEMLQKLVFPDGMIYDREKESFTERSLNLIFQVKK